MRPYKGMCLGKLTEGYGCLVRMYADRLGRVCGLYCSATVSRLLQWQKVSHVNASVKQLIGKDRKREKDSEMKFGPLPPSCCQWQMAAKSHTCAHAHAQPSHDLEWHTGSLRISLRDFSFRYSGPSGLAGTNHAAAGPGSGSSRLRPLLSLIRKGRQQVSCLSFVISV